MITEFTCGIFTAKSSDGCSKWSVRIYDTQVALIDTDGSSITFCESPPTFGTDALTELTVLMNNIKRQYKTR